MKLYQYKPLEVGFVILCVDRNPNLLRATVNSVRRRYDSPCVGVVDGDCGGDDFSELNKVCPVHRGMDTVTSLLNEGLDHPPAEWSMTVMSGTWVRPNLDKKYSLFVESTSDVLYAIVDGRYEFPDCSLNGLMVHRDAWQKVGHFCPRSPLPLCKLMWARAAIDRGCRFKGVIGVKMA